MSCPSGYSGKVCQAGGSSGVTTYKGSPAFKRSITIDEDGYRYRILATSKSPPSSLDDLTVMVSMEREIDDVISIPLSSLVRGYPKSILSAAGLLMEQCAGEIGCGKGLLLDLDGVQTPSELAFLVRGLRAYPDRPAFYAAVRAAIPPDLDALSGLIRQRGDDQEVDRLRWEAFHNTLSCLGVSEPALAELIRATRPYIRLELLDRSPYLQFYLSRRSPHLSAMASVFGRYIARLYLEAPLTSDSLADAIVAEVEGMLKETGLPAFAPDGRNLLKPVYPAADTHEAVRLALLMGRDVPLEILMRYPDLLSEFGV